MKGNIMNIENRKKIVSIKLSTLIILGIIVITIVGIKIFQKKQNNNEMSIQSKLNIKQENSLKEEIKERTLEERRILVSSRSSAERDGNPNIYIEKEIVENKSEEMIEELKINTTPIEEVKISKDMDLTIRTGLSREDFILLISKLKEDTSNFFKENAGLIYDMCEKYQINEIFLCGLISAESGWNIEQAHRKTFNYISLMSNGKLIKFTSVENGIEKAAKTLHENYLIPGGRFYYGSTLKGVKTKFCPASATWVNLVYQRMEQILK